MLHLNTYYTGKITVSHPDPNDSLAQALRSFFMVQSAASVSEDTFYSVSHEGSVVRRQI